MEREANRSSDAERGDNMIVLREEENG
jgi:hypothetical protein